ncbi:MAG: hypothetical protein Tsb0016_06080 [Sphingomonadales bacterium]
MAEPLALILHARDESAGVMMLRKILALKQLAYGLCHHPAGGGGGPPPGVVWLQWGRAVLAGPVLAAIAVEAAQPRPTLFPNGNRGLPLTLLLWSGDTATRALRNPATRAAHAALIGRQLHDGRAFMQGAQIGLADVAAWALLAASGNEAGLPAALMGWFERVSALGHGAATPLSPSQCAQHRAAPATSLPAFGAIAATLPLTDPALGNVLLYSPCL